MDGAPNDKLFDRVITPHQLLNNSTLYRLSASYYCERVINPALSRLLDIAGVDIKLWYNSMPRPRRKQVVHNKPNSTIKSSKHGRQGNADDTIQWMNRFSRGTDGIVSKSIDSFYTSNHCVVCDRITQDTQLYCSVCMSNKSLLNYKLLTTFNRYQRTYNDIINICRCCVSHDHSLIIAHTNNTNKKQNKRKSNHIIDIENIHQPVIVNSLDVVCDSLDCELTYQRYQYKQSIKQWNYYIQQYNTITINDA